MNVNLSSIVTPLRALWDDLVERRLWPVAIVLVVALVAVPVLLSKPGKPASAAPGGASMGAPTAAFQPAVSTEGKKSSQIQKDLQSFKGKNPFTPQGLSSAGAGATGAAGAAAVGTATPTVTSSGSSSPSSGSSTPSSSTGSSGGGTSTPSGSNGSTGTKTKTKKVYWQYTVDVRFGKTGNEDAKRLTDFRPLPGSDNPVVVFMGVKSDGKTAVFLVSAKATTIGDGKCSPSDTQCTFLYMKKGDKQTIEAVDTSGTVTDYTLKLTKVNVKQTTAPQKAGSAKNRARARGKSRMRMVRVESTFRALGL